MVLAKIALRNLREHKTKTLIIGVLISIGIFLLIVGNSLMDTIKLGMESSYKESFTGDLIVHGVSESTFSLFGLMGMDAMEGEIPVVEPLDQLEDYLDNSEINSNRTATATTYAMYQRDEEMVGFGMLWGIDPTTYQEVFPESLIILEGEYLPEGETGIMLNKATVESIEEEHEISLHAGDSILITSIMSDAGTKIREMKIWGIIEVNSTNMQMDMVSYADIATVREISGIDEKALTIDDLTDSEQASLGAVSEDDLFGDSMFGGGDLIQENNALDFDNLITTSTASGPEETYDSWQFIIVKTDSTRQGEILQRNLNAYFEEEGLNLRADDWQWGAGATAMMVDTIKLILNAVIIIISIVSVIIIMNTLVISVSERIPEIGTIRAIGGQKAFVRKMITWETLVTTSIFGIIGIAVGALVLGIFNLIGLQSDNTFLQLLMGGDVFRPVLSFSSVLTSFFAVVIMGTVSSLYPASIAMNIEPVKAMQNE